MKFEHSGRFIVLPLPHKLLCSPATIRNTHFKPKNAVWYDKGVHCVH